MKLWLKSLNPLCIGLIAMVLSEHSSELSRHPTISHADVTWFPLSSILDVLNSHLLQRKGCSSSHAPGPFNPHNMASSRLHSHPQVSLDSGLILARSAFSPERALLDVITSIDEGVSASF